MSEMRSSWNRYRTFHILTIWSAQYVCRWTSPLDLKVMLFRPTKCHLTDGGQLGITSKGQSVCVCLLRSERSIMVDYSECISWQTGSWSPPITQAALHSSTQLNQIQSPGNIDNQCVCVCVKFQLHNINSQSKLGTP